MLKLRAKVVKILIGGLAFIMLAPFAYAAPDLPDKPKNDIYVSDFADVLTLDTEGKLLYNLAILDKETSTQIAVVTLADLGGYEAFEYSFELARAWGIGQEGSDNGLLILIVPKEKNPNNEGSVWIQVGYGLEGAITDALTSRIVNEVMIPNFKRGDYDSAVLGAVTYLEELARGEEFTLPEPKKIGPEMLMNLLILFLPFIWVIFSVMSQSKSWVAGGLFGGAIGLLVASIEGLVLGGVLGLIIDYVLSTYFYKKFGNGGKGGKGGFWGAT